MKVYLLTYGELNGEYEPEVIVEGIFSSLSKIMDYYNNDPLAGFVPNHNHIYMNIHLIQMKDVKKK